MPGPDLPVVIRATGFYDAGSHGDQNSQYPMPVVCQQFNQNINFHDRGTMLHLTPRNSECMSSLIAHFTDDATMMSLYEQRQIYFLRPEANVCLSLQTAFATSSGIEVSRDNKEKEEYQKGYVYVSGASLLKHKLHLVGNFRELECITKETAAVINEKDKTKTPNRPLTLILDYLYNIRNSPKEIDEMINSVRIINNQSVL